MNTLFDIDDWLWFRLLHFQMSLKFDSTLNEIEVLRALQKRLLERPIKTVANI